MTKATSAATQASASAIATPTSNTSNPKAGTTKKTKMSITKIFLPPTLAAILANAATVPTPNPTGTTKTNSSAPLSAQCEQAFQFNQSGKISAHPHYPSAKTTIKQLKLDHQSLAEMRAQAINAFLFESAISLKQAQKLLEKIDDRNAKGQFRPFCFVLKQACEAYIRRGQQKQTRNKAIRSQKPS
jgi:hypothetical protein